MSQLSEATLRQQLAAPPSPSCGGNRQAVAAAWPRTVAALNLTVLSFRANCCSATLHEFEIAGKVRTFPSQRSRFVPFSAAAPDPAPDLNSSGTSARPTGGSKP